MAHGQHTETAELFGGIEYNRRKSTGHLRVKAYLYPGLNLIL